MSRQMYASSPTWYCSNVLDSDRRGFVYFVGSCSLFVLDCSCSPPQYKLHFPVCKTRAVGVSVCKEDVETGPSWRCATAGDGRVKLWHLHNRQAVHEHNAHKTAAITCVQWSTADAKLIMSADSMGNIVAWRPEVNKCEVFCPESVHVSTLACSPHSPTHVAVGYKDSSIVILDISLKGRVIQKFRGHDEEIQGLVWCPFRGENLASHKDDAMDGDGCLLASGSKDRTMRVWATSSGRCLLTQHMPNTSGHKRDKGEDRYGAKLWLALHWQPNKPRQILSASYNGEILQWDLSHSGKQKWQAFTQSRQAAAHKRIVFSLAACGTDFNTLCSVSMDRQVILWNMKDLKAKHNLASLGGFAYCLEQSPINPGHIAVGCGDHLIRVWNVENQNNPSDTQVYWQGLKSKVTAINWHPVKEGKLAYGTDDGRVGIYDLFSKLPKLASTFHRGTVYTVVWGPSIKNVDKEDSGAKKVTYNLYSCGDGRISEHIPESLDKPAFNVMDHLRKVNNIQGQLPVHSDVRWKPGHTAVAVGNDDGSVDVFGYPSLKKLCTVHVHRKLINAICWHPLYTSESDQPSKYRHWVALASSSAQVQVVDLSPVFQSELESPALITQSTLELAAHHNRVTNLSWSVLCEARLASVSYDNTAQIWNVKTGQPVANYRGHSGRLLCVQCSDLDPDLVYSGGQDNTLQCWRISEQQQTTPQAGNNSYQEYKKKTKSKKKKGEEIDTEAATNTTVIKQDTPEMDEIQQLLEAKRQELKQAQAEGGVMSITSQHADQSETLETLRPTSSRMRESGYDDVEENEEVRDLLGPALNIAKSVQQTEEIIVKRDGREKKKKRHKSLFPTSSLRDNRGKVLQHEDCLKIAQYKFQDRPPELGEEWYHLGHLVDRKATYELYRYEMAYHLSAGNWDQQMILEMFRGNLSALVAKARGESRLSDWMLGLSPVSTTEQWRALCEAYAKQLIKDQNYHKAATYLLAANKVYEAIGALREGSLYKDAVCLARVRLAPQDPLFSQLLHEWAVALARDANLELAAKCYLACGDALEAARCLARRPDTSAICTATKVCVLAGERQQAGIYGERMIHDCLAMCDWATAQIGISSSSQFEPYKVLVCAHELLMAELLKTGVINSLPENSEESSPNEHSNSAHLPVLRMESSNKDIINPWPVFCQHDGQSFACYLVQCWVEKWDVSISYNMVQHIYEFLSARKPERQGVLQQAQLLFALAFEITLGTLQTLLGNADKTAQHWSQALATVVTQMENSSANAANMDFVDLACTLCQLLLPLGPGGLKPTLQQVFALSVTINQDEIDKGRCKTFTLSERHIAIIGGNGPHNFEKSLNNKSTELNSWDSLQAQYCYCVLLHWNKLMGNRSFGRSNQKENQQIKRLPRTPEKATSSMSPQQNAASQLQSSPQSNDSVEDIVKELETNHKDSVTLPSEEVLFIIAQSLLWDVHVKKHHIKDSLSFIQKAVASLVAKNRTDSNNVHLDPAVPAIDQNWRIPRQSSASPQKLLAQQNSEAAEENGMDDATKLRTPKMSSTSGLRAQRALSGEYLPMDGARKSLFRKKPHEQLLDNVKNWDTEDFVLPDQPEFSEDQDVSLTIGSNEIPENVVPQSETKVYQKALSIFTDELDDDKTQANEVKNSPVNKLETPVSNTSLKKNNRIVDAKDVTIDLQSSNNEQAAVKKIETGSNDITNLVTSSTSCDGTSSKQTNNSDCYNNSVYSEVPPEWFDLPVNVKYTHPCVTLPLLSREQSRLQNEMQHLHLSVKVLPFPDPRRSALMMKEVKTPDEELFSEMLQQWLDGQSNLCNKAVNC